MAYAALVSLVQTIDKLLQHHNYQCPISPHDEQQLVLIHDFITSLQTFLENFPEEANSLEGRIRDVANEAEDIIEFGMSDQIKLYHNTLKSSAGSESHVMLHCDFNELNKVMKEIDSIRGEVTEIKNSTRSKNVQLSAYSSIAASLSRLIAPTSKDGAMVGLDDDLMAIKARLCGESSKLQVIPIFGMGGIGKTTLARNVYDDPLTVEHFDIRAWVTVSQDYSAQEILSSLLDSMKVERSGQSNELMREIVYKRLKGRRYVIIMDDIWSTEAWDDLKMIFPNDNNGSRIILTTRLFNVAAYPDSSSPLHEMHFMDADQSWTLLQQKVFLEENCPPELETIGKTIARSCRGLPLAIVMIAGLLSTVSSTQDSWENIAKNVNLAISSTNDEQFTKILYLSYIHLPHHLRLCFLYMGGFPEDYEICVSKLIKLWVAEGFSKQSESKSFEEDAEENLEDLAKRSLIMVTKRKSNGKIKSCSIHDLVRDLCIRKAREEKFHLNLINRDDLSLLGSIKNQRRISIAFADMRWLIYKHCSTIRTILFFRYTGISLGFHGNCRLLRVLNVEHSKMGTQSIMFTIKSLPDEVFELFHLRYLAFTATPLVLSPSILNLQNLQTLLIHGGAHLPLEIWRMPQLRHLIFIGPLPNIPEGAPTFALENLQTLSTVGDFKCREEILKMIPNLKKLGIIYTREEYVQDIHLDNLVHLCQLEKLKLEVHLGSFQGKLNLAFPATLKKLTLIGRGLRWEDMSIVGSLPNLEVLKLRYYTCYGDKWETSEGEFPRLKFLLIDELELCQWITESSHFPSLSCLLLYRCRNLSEIPDDIGEIPTLELIEVDDWNKSLVESAKRIQEEQETLGNDALQVRVGETWRK